MDDQSNNAAFVPTEPLNDDATTSRLQEPVDPPRPAPTSTEMTEWRNPIRAHGAQAMRLVVK
jgi:hypothetical protein